MKHDKVFQPLSTHSKLHSALVIVSHLAGIGIVYAITSALGGNVTFAVYGGAVLLLNRLVDIWVPGFSGWKRIFISMCMACICYLLFIVRF